MSSDGVVFSTSFMGYEYHGLITFALLCFHSSTVLNTLTFGSNYNSTPVVYRANVVFADKKQKNTSFTIHVTSGWLFGIHDLDLSFFIKWDEQRLGQVSLHNIQIDSGNVNVLNIFVFFCT